MAPRPARPVFTPRSSRNPHSFPAFYACYLLRSIKTPESKTIYIGSTPSPPRRIRQHNGEITQGARKTESKRPWVMQMIVHGFPSRHAALQFEWAWQNPHRSRHLKDDNNHSLFSRKARMIKGGIEVVQAMIRSHPWNLWPLHVKLFTEEARDVWNMLLDRRSKAVEKAARGNKIGRPEAAPAVSRESHFPPGFTCTVELEGVDGRSGHPEGSGRTGPLSVKDEQFSSLIWAKNTAVLASTDIVSCAVCGGGVAFGQEDPLNTTLCPHDACLSVSHFSCLAQHFLSSNQIPPDGSSPISSSSIPESSSSSSPKTAAAAAPARHAHTFTQQSTFIPRGGQCPTCDKYTLWGDIVRGLYRRKMGPAEAAASADKAVEDEDLDDGLASDDLYTSDSEVDLELPGRRIRGRKVKGKARASEEGEDEDEGVAVTPKKRRKAKSSNGSESPSGESFDLDVSATSSSDELMTEILQKPKRGKGKSKKAKAPRAKGKAKEVISNEEASSPTKKRPNSNSHSGSNSGSDNDMFLPDPVTPKPPKAKVTRAKGGGRKRIPATLLDVPLANLETEPAVLETPKPKRGVGRPRKDTSSTTSSSSPSASRSYYTSAVAGPSTSPTNTMASRSPAPIRTPRPFPLSLLDAHPVLGSRSNLNPKLRSTLLLPDSDSDSGSDRYAEDVFDFAKLGSGVRVTRQVVQGELREVVGFDESVAGSEVEAGNGVAQVVKRFRELGVNGSEIVGRREGAKVIEVSSGAESGGARRVIFIDSDSD